MTCQWQRIHCSVIFVVCCMTILTLDKAASIRRKGNYFHIHFWKCNDFLSFDSHSGFDLGQRGSEGRWVKGVKPESFSWYHPDDPICVVYIIRPNFTSIWKVFALLFDWNVLGLTWTLDLYLMSSGTEWSSVGVPHSYGLRYHLP
jgi:hypothetical protein